MVHLWAHRISLLDKGAIDRDTKGTLAPNPDWQTNQRKTAPGL